MKMLVSSLQLHGGGVGWQAVRLADVTFHVLDPIVAFHWGLFRNIGESSVCGFPCLTFLACILYFVMRLQHLERVISAVF